MFSAREYFKAAQAALRLIDARTAMVNRLRSQEGLKGVSFDSVGGSGGVSDPMSATDRRMDAEKELAAEIQGLQAEVDEARQLCKRVHVIDPTCTGGGLIDLHYFGFLSWRDAAASMGVSEAFARREADRAYKLIEDVGVERMLRGWAQEALPL